MASPKGNRPLVIGIFLMVFAVLAYEAGGGIDKSDVFRSLDLLNSRISRIGNAIWGPLDTAASSAANIVEIGKYEVKEDPTAINVKAFGAKGDGVKDDTAALQDAINAVPAAGGKVYVPPGTYMVEAMQSVRLKSGVTLLLSKGAVLRAIPNGAERYAVLTIENVSKVTVVGGVIQGERRRHIGDKGQWGTGVQISGARDVTILGTAAIDCWGDGFYIGTETFTGPDHMGKILKVPENIRLIDIKADNNRRQGISLIAGRNVEIVRPQLTNTHGIDPESGIDIEPNDKWDVIENVVVADAITKGNAGAGVLINLASLTEVKTPASIKIVNHQDDGSTQGMKITDITSIDNIVKGTVIVENSVWVNAKKNGLLVTNHDYRSYDIIVKNPQISDANRGGSRFDPFNGSAVAIYYDGGGNKPSRTGVNGNVTIYNPVIVTSGGGPRLVTPFLIRDESPGRNIQKVLIFDPVINGNKGPSSELDTVRQYINYTQEKTER